MVTAEELTVAIRSEGVGETQQDLEGVERAMEDTADSAGDSAEELQGFSEKFAGAMSSAVTALAIGAAGLLSQVPVLGETFAGLGAIVDAVAYQMDGVLRPALSPLTNLMFDLSQGIYEADGAAGDIIGVFATVASLVGLIAGAATAASVQIFGLSTTFGYVSGAVGSLSGSLSGVLSGITGFISGSLAAAAALGALIGVLTVGILEVTGFNDMVRGLGQTLAKGLPGWAADGFTALLAAALGPLAVLGGAILGFVKGTLEGGLSEGIDRAVSTAKQVLAVFEGAWERTLGRIDSVVDDIVTAAVEMAAGFVGAVEQFGEDTWNYFVGLASALTSWASGLAQDAFDWGVSLMQGLLDGILSLAEAVVSAIEDVVNRMTETIDAAISKLPDDVTSRLGIEQIGSINVDTSFGGRDAAASAGEAPGPARTGNRATNTERTTQIDGRQLSESTGRYRSDPARRRGN